MRRTALTPLLPIAALALLGRQARAEITPSLHLEGAAARMVGEPSPGQYGWGAAGYAAGELALNRYAGLELGVAGISLTEGAQDPTLQPTREGSAIALLGGVRLRPLAGIDRGNALSPRGLWFAGGGGATRTGDLLRPALDVRAGYDITAGDLAVGPFGGLVQILQPEGGVRPEDARILQLGAHVVFGVPPRPPPPDPDRDRDGLENDDDQCPDEAEDKDGFQDQDGCPDPDNDRDGIADASDRCPMLAEDKDGFQDQDGCPDLDNDGDGIADAKDKCPNEAEDVDGNDDGDGCVDPDDDGDGIADVNDRCPFEPETFNGYADEDGCPDVQQVRVVGSDIHLDDRIYFGFDQSDVRRDSHQIVAKLAELLRSHPEYARVRIQGFADDTGAADYNLKLSEARANAVRSMLVEDGIAADRLEVQAFGEQKPEAQGTSATARRKNRRVAFVILERRTELVSTPAPTAPSAAINDEEGGAP
jgi:outer membrane protein OmpA-like peptidoglycan-associated protein